MSSELQLRTAILEKILRMHEALLWPCIDRWIAWRPSDHLEELRRRRAQHNKDSGIGLRLPSLDDPSFFFWSIFNTQDEVFPEFDAHPRISLRRVIGIRNAGVHGDKVTSESLAYLDYCSNEMLRILDPTRAVVAGTVPATGSAAGSVAVPTEATVSVLDPDANEREQEKHPVASAPPAHVPPPAPVQHGMTQVLVFYVVCDKSASMAGDAIDVVNQSLTEMHHTLISDPIVADKCRMGIVSFSSTAKVELALCAPHQVVSMPVIDAEGITNYGSAFSLVKSQIDADLPRISQTHRPLRPIVYFMTDGSPSDASWKTELTRLVDAGELYAPTVIVMPIGHVDDKVLEEMTDIPTGITPRILRVAHGNDLSEAVRASIHSITSSVVNTIRNDDEFLAIDGLDELSEPDTDPDVDDQQ